MPTATSKKSVSNTESKTDKAPAPKVYNLKIKGKSYMVKAEDIALSDLLMLSRIFLTEAYSTPKPGKKLDAKSEDELSQRQYAVFSDPINQASAACALLSIFPTLDRTVIDYKATKTDRGYEIDHTFKLNLPDLESLGDLLVAFKEEWDSQQNASNNDGER